MGRGGEAEIGYQFTVPTSPTVTPAVLLLSFERPKSATLATKFSSICRYGRSKYEEQASVVIVGEGTYEDVE
jgi:hypothetical protein